jgi:hypothetical protein
MLLRNNCNEGLGNSSLFRVSSLSRAIKIGVLLEDPASVVLNKTRRSLVVTSKMPNFELARALPIQDRLSYYEQGPGKEQRVGNKINRCHLL